MMLGFVLILAIIGISTISMSDGTEFCIFGEQIMLNHTMTDKSISSMCMDKDAQSIIMQVGPDSEGTLTVDIPRKVVNPVFSCEQDKEFFVLLDGEEQPYEEIKNTEKFRRLLIPFTNDIQEIEVIGTFVSMMPESLPDCSYKYEGDRITIPPIQQIKFGIEPQNVICEKNRFLMIKNDQTPVCVKYESLFILENRGWGFIPDITKNRHIQWSLEEYKIPITLDNITLNYIRASYETHSILMYVTVKDGSNSGLVEFEFPKKATSLIFEGAECTIFTDSPHIEEFDLKVNEKSVGTVSAKYAYKSQDTVLLRIIIPAHSSLVEIFSKC